MDDQTLKLIGFPQVLELLQNLAQTPAGCSALERFHPADSCAVTARRSRLVEELTDLIETSRKIDLAEASEMPEAVDRLAQSGRVLEPAQLLAVARGVRLACRAADRCRESDKSGLSALLASARDLGSVSSEIERVIDDDGLVRSSADPELAAIRRQIKTDRRRLEKCLQGYLKGRTASYLISEPYITRRNDRYVIPVRVETQARIPGVVHASSGSGATLFLEPLEAVDLNNRLIHSEAGELRRIQKLMARLSRVAGKQAARLASLVERLALLDACQAAAEFARRHRCCLAESSSGDLCLENARHPLLEAAGTEVVPITIRLSRKQRILVISGPNAGGKTVALKTIGLFCCMAQAGLPIPAERGVLPSFCAIHADIGDHQSIDRSLSTFSAHVQRAVEILERVQAPSLVLLDEVGSATDPALGAALAIVLMEELSQDAIVVSTTHLDRIKAFADSSPRAINASVELDQETMSPTFQLVFGRPGGSSAFQIASRLGFPEELLERARGRLSESRIEVEEQLELLRRQTRQLSRKEEELEKERATIEQRLAGFELEKKDWERQRTGELERKLSDLEKEFRGEAGRLLKGVRDKFEGARIRKETARRRQRLKAVFRERLQQGSRVEPKPRPQGSTLQVGSTVWAAPLKRMARVTEVGEEEASIEVEGKRMRLKLSQLEPGTVQRRTLEPRPQVRLEVVEDTNRELNLIGNRVDEALLRTDKFLDRAFVSSLREVRLIHGFGSGRLARAIEKFVREHPHVRDFEREGGATLVRLER